ncbi:MAG: hypothetical protein WBG13_30540, partial [Pseudolabrys sp.]
GLTQPGRSQSRMFLELEKTPKNKKRKTPIAVFNYSRAAVAHSLVKKKLSEIRRWPSTSRNNPARFAVFSPEISITGEAP